MDNIDLINRDRKDINGFLLVENNCVLGEPNTIHSCDW